MGVSEAPGAPIQQRIVQQRDSGSWDILEPVQSLVSESEVTAVDAKKLSQIADFVRDERRLDTAFVNVLEGIDSGAIAASDLPISAAPVQRVTLGQGDAVYAASMVEKVSGVALDDAQRTALLRVVQDMPSGGTFSALVAEIAKMESLSALAEGLKEVQTAGIYDSLFTQTAS
ncbi:hypothetical protein MF6394_02185 [Pseudomonas sp. MF6394]|jgi:hypothetical protein|nr:hypothetical protein MF6394_02185 [Pseudomonas sp. MF6394]